ncbi:MAG: protein BatD [Deltaproteobacteria bacterium]|nr:protein BatD [Deltaproteobacteria bacterium]
MKKIAATIVLVLSCLLVSMPGAAEVGVVLTLERTEATPADTIRMQVSVSGSRSQDRAPAIRGLESFHVTQGGTSSRVQIVNGKMNAGIEYSYFIQPRKTGTFTIGPAEIEVDGTRLTSNTVMLDVKEASRQPGADRGSVFIETSLSSDDVYVEEQAIYIIKLFYRVGVDNLSLGLPEIEHVTFKQLGRPGEYQTSVDGKTYGVVEIRYALVASQTGDYVIGPTTMKMTVRQSGTRSRFDDFFRGPLAGSSGRPVTVGTNPIELTVRDLPEAGRPAGFSGLVGMFRMDSALEPTALKAGDSATLTIRVNGRGNVQRIPDIKLPELSFARTYCDQPVLETEEASRGIGGTKTMKWALVPENAGTYRIPPVTLSFFNPDTERYATLKTPAYTLSVSPGEKQEVTPFQVAPGAGKQAGGSAKQEVRQVGTDILPIHTQIGNLSVPWRGLATGWRLWLVLFAPLVLYLALLGGIKVYNRSPEHLSQLKSRNAYRSLQKRCRHLRPGGADLIEAFTEYLNDRFSLSIGVLTADDTMRVLRERGAHADTAGAIRLVIQRLENAVYAGTELKDTDATHELLKLVRKLEKEIR